MADSPIPRVAVIGPAGAGKSTLLRLMSGAGRKTPQVQLDTGENLIPSADALIFACPASADATVLRESLVPIAEQLNQLSRERGQDCAVAALPVFLVLTQCDRLVQPKDTLGDWLERIEACKLQAEQTLRGLLTPGQSDGFGTPALHFWATAEQRAQLDGQPAATPEPFGVRELLQQASEAARDHARRQQLQGTRLGGLIWLTALLLLLLTLVTVAWGWLSPTRRETVIPEARKPWPEGDYLVHGKAALADARKLLRFEEYRPGSPALTEWPRWYRDATASIHDLQEVRAKLGAEKIGQTLSAELLVVELNLTTVQQRAALFGLAGDVPGRPAVLHFPAEPVPYEGLRKQVQDRLLRFAKFYPTFGVEPLPALLPLGVAVELHDAALISYEKLLEPVQTEIRARVLRLGDGRETPLAWRELADGWLSVQAENELYEWRELAVLLQRLAGRSQPADPLTQLASFLRQSAIPLPLERVELQLPASLMALGETYSGLRPGDGPLVITRRTDMGEVTTLNLLPLSGGRTLPGEPERYLYGVARQNPLVNGRLIFKPGDDIAARLKIVDDQGRKWLLTWPLADSRSLVWSFSVLSQAPRLHAEDQPASKGAIAFGVRLVFSEPRLFELPDLMPR